MTGNVPQRRAGTRAGLAPLLVLPGLGLLLVFSYWPLVRTGWLSLHGSDLLGRPTRWVGLDNLHRVLTDPALLRVVATTVVVTAGSVVLATGTALVAGLLLRTTGRRVRAVGGVVLSLPFAYSAAAASATFAGLFTPSVGVLDRAAAALGVPGPGWLTDPVWAVVSIVLATAWYEAGFAVLVLLAALSRLDPSVLEAAALDGAGDLRTSVSIVVPALRPSLLFPVVTQTVTGLQVFTQVQVLTRGGPAGATTTIVQELYERAFGAGVPQYGVASALALVLLVLVLVVSAAQFRLGRER